MKLWNSGLLAKFINGKTISQAEQSCFQEKKKKKTEALEEVSWIDTFFEILISGIMTMELW